VMEAEDQDVDFSRERLSNRADYVRARMLSRVDTLDERRHQASRTISSAVAKVRQNMPLLAGAAAVAVLGIGVVALLRRRRRSSAELMAAWHPPVEHQRSTMTRVLTGVGTSLLLHFAKQIGEAALLKAVQARQPRLPPREPRYHGPLR
jgi:hypothetical protein